MEIFIGVIIGIVILIIIIAIVIYRNKIGFVQDKIDVSQESIDKLIDKKRELLIYTSSLIKREIDKNDFLDYIDDITINEKNSFELNDLLKRAYNDLFLVIEEHDKLTKSDELIKTIDEINDVQEALIGSIKYYNDNVVQYNMILKTFPNNIIAFISRNKPKRFYEDEKRNIKDIISQDDSIYPEAYRNINIIRSRNSDDIQLEENIEKNEEDKNLVKEKTPEQEKIENTKNIKVEIENLNNTSEFKANYESKVDNDIDLDDLFNEVKDVVKKSHEENIKDEEKEIDDNIQNDKINDDKDIEDNDILKNDSDLINDAIEKETNVKIKNKKKKRKKEDKEDE